MTSSADALTNWTPPTRGAALKAAASFAEQLIDSPGRSDVDSPSSSNPFREPTHRTKSVKYRYTATGKHLSSPLKGSSSSPERKIDKPKKSKLATLTPAPSSHAARGKARAVATTSRKRKASATSFHKEDLLRSTFLSSPSPLSSVPTSPIVPTRDLSPSPALTTKDSVPGPPRQLTASQTISDLRPLASPSTIFSQPLSTKRKQKNRTNAQNGADPWDIGNSVWVLVNQSGQLADNGTRPQNALESTEPLMWWPAQVVQKQPLRVSLFGDFPSSSSTNRGLCTIFTPSSSNVQSINDDSGAMRFSRTTFSLLSLSTDDDAGPPTKKPRLDDIASMETRWEAAVHSMDKASTLEKDGLPALLSSYAATGDTFYDSLDDSDLDTSDLTQPSRKPANPALKKPKQTGSTRKLKSRRAKPNIDYGDVGSRQGSPCPPDPTLQIPGELVLALAPRTGGSYWPAQILRHVPSLKERYEVKFLDEKVYVITRDKFWTSEEEGFVQCTLGEWESAIKTTDDQDSGDEDGEFSAGDTNAQGLDESALLPPPLPQDFDGLSVRAQLAYVKPVLQAILNKEYVPAREKHEAFMRGGSSRVALLKSAGVRGGMDARFVKAVQKAICEWLLGDSRVRPRRLDIVTGSSEMEGSTGPKVASPEATPAEVLPCGPMQDDKMEGVESTTAPADVYSNRSEVASNGALPLATPGKQVEIARVAEMAVDIHEQDPASLLPPANSINCSPVINQAALAPKSQLDLLAEVSQAVATEPSLLPSHPELPKLKLPLFDTTRQDTPSQPSPLTPISDEEQQPLLRNNNPPFVCEEFTILSGVEKLDYCLNVLLPESIQQLLLWRSGERTSPTLLSPEEEQRLHDVGARKAVETDWVDDVMRLRAAQARLWGIDLNKKAEEKIEVQGGTRSRPRRATVSRP